MDTENLILYSGIFLGWLISIAVVGIVGMIAGVSEIIAFSMLGISAGVLTGLFLIAEICCFFKRYKIVRRE